MSSFRYKTFTAEQLHDMCESVEWMDSLLNCSYGDMFFENVYREDCDFSAKKSEDFCPQSETQYALKDIEKIIKGLRDGTYKLEIV